MELRFNTQPPEGGCPKFLRIGLASMLFQHTAARRRLRVGFAVQLFGNKFQHTAARRRLPVAPSALERFVVVSTHSRPKAAAGSTRAPGA